MDVSTSCPLPFAPIAAVVLACSALAGAAPGQQPMARASVDSNGGEADRGGYAPAISADGRYVAFESAATNLVADDTNDLVDIFVHDRVTGATVRVSVDSSGNEGDGPSRGAALSADGRFVAFTSDAAHLVLHDTNSRSDVFLHDRDPDGNGVFDEGNGGTTRVSVDSSGKQGNGASDFAAISADGSRIAFQSTASNLVAGDGNGLPDIFVRDVLAGTTVRVSVDSSGAEADGWSLGPSISADGRVVAFTCTASNLVAGDFNDSFDVFLHDLTTGATTRVSVDSAGAEANNLSFTTPGALSADGTRVVFLSGADNLVAGDTNGISDAFLHDVTTGATSLVNLGQDGAQAEVDTWDVSISGDGRTAIFSTLSDHLVPLDGNHFSDGFRRDLDLGATELVSRDFSTKSGDGDSYTGAVSGDGSVVVFESLATDLVAGDANGWIDVFAYDRAIVPLQAAWSNYDSGFPGTFGIPSLTLTADPEFGASLALVIGNSSAQWSVAFLVLGSTRASLPIGGGGTLLVLPQSILPCGLPPVGFTIGCTVPYDDALYGLLLDAQAVEFDAGARGGLSFTSGLELVFGQ